MCLLFQPQLPQVSSSLCHADMATASMSERSADTEGGSTSSSSEGPKSYLNVLKAP